MRFGTVNNSTLSFLIKSETQEEMSRSNYPLYEDRALEKSLWNILISHYSDRPDEREHYISILMEMEEFVKRNQLFDHLNRTRTEIRRRVQSAEHRSNLIQQEKQAVEIDNADEEQKIIKHVRFTKHKSYLPNRPAVEYHTSTSKNSHDYVRQYILEAENLHRVCQIPLGQFDLTADEKRILQSNDRYAFDLSNKDELTAVDSTFPSRYRSAFDMAFKNLRTRLYVYEYLESFPGKHGELKAYYDVNNHFQERIETALEESETLSYTRVITLPLRLELMPHEPPERLIEQFLYDSSIPLLMHVCRCLKKGLTSRKSPDPGIRPGFFLLNRCIRPYQFAVLDQVISSEYYRINLSQQTFPTFLYVKRVLPDDENTNMELRANLKTFKRIFNLSKGIGEFKEPVSEVDKPLELLHSHLVLFEELLSRMIEGLKSPKHQLSGKEATQLLKNQVQQLNDCINVDKENEGTVFQIYSASLHRIASNGLRQLPLKQSSEKVKELSIKLKAVQAVLNGEMPEYSTDF